MARKPPPLFRHGDLIEFRLVCSPRDPFGKRETFKARIEFNRPSVTTLITLSSVGCKTVTSRDETYQWTTPLHQWAVQMAQDIQESSRTENTP